MHASVRLELPRIGITVPTARRLVETLATAAGARRHVVADLAVALSEACTNAVEHARGDQYEVNLRIDDGTCQIEVVDHGAGFEAGDLDMPAPLARDGRGIPLMEALIDHVEVRALPGGGTQVVLRHSLRLATEAHEVGGAGGGVNGMGSAESTV